MPWWSYLIIAIPAVAVVVALVLVLMSRCKYTRRASMLTDPENYFYHVVRFVLPEGYTLVPQPAMIACFDAKHSDRTAINRILSKRFDYAIVRTAQERVFPYQRLVTVAVIELDDRSHNAPARKKRDKFVEKTCNMNRLPLLRYPSLPNSAPNYNVDQIRADIIHAIRVGDIY